MFYKFVFIHKQNISLFSKQSKKCKQYNNNNYNNNNNNNKVNNNNNNKNKKTNNSEKWIKRKDITDMR